MNEGSDQELLDRLREWLAEARAAGESLARAGERASDRDAAWPGEGRPLAAEGPGNGVVWPQAAAAPAAEVDPPGASAIRLVEGFTALRHEIKLQTKSARGVEEEIGKLLAALSAGLETIRSVEPKEAQAAWSAAKGLALALAELDEALVRGRRELERAGVRLVEEPRERLRRAIEAAHAAQGWWRRKWSRGLLARAVEAVSDDPQRRERRELFTAILDGYDLIQQRLSRSLAAEGVTPVAALGRPVDPEQMVVLELVDAAGPPGIVVEEIRRGYLWKGRVLRYAEVRASRTPAEF